MTIYVGEGVTIICYAKNPIDDTVISVDTAQVTFYAPGKNPAKVPADRTADKGPFTLSFNDAVDNADGSKGAYVGVVDTTGWDPGKWSYRVELSDALNSWEYASFKLEA